MGHECSRLFLSIRCDACLPIILWHPRNTQRTMRFEARGHLPSLFSCYFAFQRVSILDFRVSSSRYEKWLSRPCLIRSNEKWRSILSELHAGSKKNDAREEMSFLLFLCNSAVFFDRFSKQYVLYKSFDIYIKISYVKCSGTSVSDCILNRIKDQKHKWLKRNDESPALRW